MGNAGEMKMVAGKPYRRATSAARGRAVVEPTAITEETTCGSQAAGDGHAAAFDHMMDAANRIREATAKQVSEQRERIQVLQMHVNSTSTRARTYESDNKVLQQRNLLTRRAAHALLAELSAAKEKVRRLEEIEESITNSLLRKSRKVLSEQKK